jgi:hypothetical protein
MDDDWGYPLFHEISKYIMVHDDSSIESIDLKPSQKQDAEVPGTFW